MSQVLLGFNNLHNSDSKSFEKADIAALSVALEMAIGGGDFQSLKRLGMSEYLWEHIRGHEHAS